MIRAGRAPLASSAAERSVEAAPWGDEFGMFVDRFGINWLVNIAGQASS